MLTANEKRQKLARNLLSILLLLLGLLFPQPHNSQSLRQKPSLRLSKPQACQQLPTRPLLLVCHPLPRCRVLRILLNKQLQEVSMVDTVQLRTQLCHPNLTMPSASRLRRPRVRLKATKVSNRNHSLSNRRLVPSLLPQINSRHTTPQILSKEMPITITTTSMACSKVLRAKRALLLNSDRLAGITGPNPRTRLNSHRALLSRRNRVTRQLARVKTAATLPLIQWLKVSNPEPVRVLSHSPAINNSHNTPTVTLTTPAHTMLRT